MTITREQILAMQPGRDLDALVAERVFGWTRHPKKPHRTDNRAIGGVVFCRPECPGIDFGGALNYVAHYSTDIASAWLVVEKLIETTPRGDVQVNHFDGQWGASLGHNAEGYERGPSAFAPTAPEAICKAALLATL